MEVPGKRNDTKDETKLCYKCKKNGKQTEAFKHCRNCNIHLCDICVKDHETNRNSKPHTLKKRPSANDPLPTCTEHQTEKVNYFCRTHEVIGCIACISHKEHKECETDYIPDISEKFLKSKEFFHYKVVSEELKTRFAENMKKAKENDCKVEQACGRAMEVIKSIKKEIMDYIDKFEIELEKEVMSFKNANKDHTMKIESDLESLRKETFKIEKQLDQLEKENKYNALFLEFKRAEKFMFDCQESLYEISTKNLVKELIFLPSTEQKTFMCKEKLFGNIEEINSKTGPFNAQELLEKQLVCTVNIYSKDDKKSSCYASGLTFLSNDLLAVADKTNHKIKVVDVRKDKIISEKTLSSSPNDLTAIHPEKIAVALGKEKKIQILTNYNELAVTETFRTNGICHGVKYDGEDLIVAYDSHTKPRIEILSLSGEILHKFNIIESSIGTGKEFVAIDLSPDHNQIYLTGINRKLLRLSKLGCVTVFNNQHKYTGVAVSIGGSVYASSKDESIIVQLSDDLSISETVLTKTEGVKSPLALAISKARNMMYVSCGSSDAAIANRLLVFKIKLESYDAVLFSRQHVGDDDVVLYSRQQSD